jgi:hypothetical protein
MSAGFQFPFFRNWFFQRTHETMECVEVRELLPGYLDGAIPERSGQRTHARVWQHLDHCASCRAELRTYRELSGMMAAARRVSPPAQLGVAIRSAVSRARANAGFSNRMRRLHIRLELLLDHILEPLAVPATGGLLTALVVFGIVCQVLGVGMPLRTTRADSPTSLLQPARLETLAGFETASLAEANRSSDDESGLLVEATVNADGQAVDYRVLSGQVDLAMRRQLDQVVLFSRFRPQLNFGRPTSGGRVVLSFAQVRVHG